jgi:hypothetical protein
MMGEDTDWEDIDRLELDQNDPVMVRHRRFLENYRKSHKAVNVVGHFYRYWGRGLYLPPIKMAPTPAEARNYRDDFDLQLIYQGKTIGMGVKRLKHQFVGPPTWNGGFPFNKAVIGAVDDVEDHMLDHVEQWALVSKDLSTMLVTYAKDQLRWFIEPLVGKITNEPRDHYFIHPKYCEFYALEPPVKLNDEDLQHALLSG